MKSYEETVDNMMRFLKRKDVCKSSINSHRSCYQQFQQFMHEHGKKWQPATVSEWISELKQKESSSLYNIWNLYMQQLEELKCTGTVLDRHLYLNRSTYDRLSETMRPVLDDFLLAYKDHYTSRSWLIHHVHGCWREINLQECCSFLKTVEEPLFLRYRMRISFHTIHRISAFQIKPGHLILDMPAGFLSS